jgi:hypothetical protein
MRSIQGILLFFSLLSSFFVHAQLSDDFSDGNFTLNPSWTGSSTDFVVNTSQQVQLNNTVAGTSYLSSPHGVSNLLNHEWQCWVKQVFSPSSSNFGKIYLSADNADLNSVQNGYYLLFGEANAVDAIRLFKLENGISTQLCAGVDGQISASFVTRIKVVLSASGTWNLYALALSYKEVQTTLLLSMEHTLDLSVLTRRATQRNSTTTTFTSERQFSIHKHRIWSKQVPFHQPKWMCFLMKH